MSQIVLRRFRPDPPLILRRFGPDGRLAALAERADGVPLPMVVAVLEGGSVARYTHTQSAASALWTVNHNLGFIPSSVSVRTVGGVEVEAGVTHISINQLNIEFAVPFAGTALII
jgi:hypothetical protein